MIYSPIPMTIGKPKFRHMSKDKHKKDSLHESNLRLDNRRLVFLSGILKVENNHIPCIVRNISISGAMIEVLNIPKKENYNLDLLDNISRRITIFINTIQNDITGHLAWVNFNYVGISFDEGTLNLDDFSKLKMLNKAHDLKQLLDALKLYK
jgi:hypothetical protein